MASSSQEKEEILASIEQRSPFAKVIVYYILLLGAVIAILWLIPSSRDLVLPNALGGGEANQGEGFPFGINGTGTVRVGLLDPLQLALYTALAIFGAVVLMIPVTWVYTLTRGRKGWSQSTVQALLILPIAVAGIVVLVQDSLALAFSLAGIVAAVRFRTTLKDTKDAVFIFVALAVGLAAGVQALAVAFVTSSLYNLVVLILWRADIGRCPPDVAELVLKQRRARAMANAAYQGTLIGPSDPQVLSAMSPDQLGVVAAKARQLQEQIESLTELEEQEKLSTHLRITATDAEAAQRAVEKVLQDHAKRWQLDRISTSSSGDATLHFLVKLKKSAEPAAVLQTIKAEGAPFVVSSEIE